MSRAAAAARALLLAAAAALAGCCELRGVDLLAGDPLPPPPVFRDMSLDVGLVRRVLVLPLDDEAALGAETGVVSLALVDEITQLRRFDVVQPAPADAALQRDEGPRRTGRVPIATIVDLGRRYGVDAVLFGTITRWRPYDPPALGLSLSLIDVETGKILWAVADHVDAADAASARAMEIWFDRHAAAEDLVFDAEILRTSPRWFTRFAAHRVASTLAPTSG